MRRLFTIWLPLFLCGILSAQTNFYVSAYAGNDTQNGTSWQTAYRTLDKALDQVGSTTTQVNIYVAQGSYLLDGSQGKGNTEYVLGNNQKVSIFGGYATPVTSGNSPAYNPALYKTAITTVHDRAASSAFRFAVNTNPSLTIKDVTIQNAKQGDNLNAALVTFDTTNGASLNMDNVKVSEWRGGNAGLIYLNNSQNSKVNLTQSLFERSANAEGEGQLVVVNNGNRNVDIMMDSSIVRNIRGIGLFASVFYIDLNCTVDRGESSLIISNSEFNNIKRGRAAAQAPAVIRAIQLPLLQLTNNKFQGNTGGNGGVIQFSQSGMFNSNGNLYQDNFSGQSAGAVWIRDSYPCSGTQVSNPVNNTATFTNDKFISNRAGIDALSGRGGAIHIANDLLGDGTTNKPVIIDGSQFLDNYTSAYDGGAIYANISAPLIIKNSVFCNNKANVEWPGQVDGDGGAVYAEGSGSLTISNSTFINNRAQAKGGAISSDLSGTVKIDGCSYFDGNRADNEGGAVAINNFTGFTLDSATFLDNISETSNGGALYIDNSGSVVPTISNINFTGNTAANHGGAIFSNAPLTLNVLSFTANRAAANGGAVFGNQPLTITNSNFNNNLATVDGGAIYGDRAVNVTNSSFNSNAATNGDGGAIAVVTRANLTYNLVNFINNTAGDQGGAMYLVSAAPSSSDASIVLTQAYFEGNTAVTEGGALFLSGYGITTATPSAAAGNVIFIGNKAGTRGGAIDIYKPGTQDVLLYGSKYINNDGGNFGGAIYLDGVTALANQYIINNHFIGNEANTQGGAIYVVNATGTNDIDLLNGNRFWNNTLNGNANNSTLTQRSDIYLNGGARIGSMNNNFLQFVATTTNYPSQYGLGTGNQQQTTALSATVIAYPIEGTTVTVCSPKECPVKENTPVSPIVVSATGNINSGNPNDYTSFTEVAIDGKCNPEITEVAFTAKSNRIPNGNNFIIDPVKTPELIITYALTITNNLTGISITNDNLVISASTPGIRIEDPADEINTGVTSELVRDVYKTYFLNVTDQIQPGYTYAYSITSVEVVEATGSITFDYNKDQYETHIIIQNCPCIIAPNLATTNVKPTKVGISTLHRNVNEWLPSPDVRGAYIVLESSTKGLVVPRYNTTAEIQNNIGTAGTAGIEEGMLVWDNEANCLKMFYDNNGDGIMTWNCISNDSCTN